MPELTGLTARPSAHHGSAVESRLAVVDPVAAVIGGQISTVPAPVWAPWPVPQSWVFSGLAFPGSPGRDGSAVTCWSGPDPFGDPAELLLISEEAGAGVGSHFAALAVTYPGPEVGEGTPHAKFEVEDRPVPLWAVSDVPPDRAVYAGEAAGRWLWVVVHPAEAGALVVEPVHLVDARELGAELTVLPVGELSPRLVVD
jgi:hypothetical protein